MYRLREGETSGLDDLSVDGFMAFLEGMFSLCFLIVAALSRLALAPEIRRFLSDPGVHREARKGTRRRPLEHASYCGIPVAEGHTEPLSGLPSSAPTARPCRPRGLLPLAWPGSAHRM